MLYQTLAEHWAAFRERAEEAGGLPKFVVDEITEYLRCGLLGNANHAGGITREELMALLE